SRQQPLLERSAERPDQCQSRAGEQARRSDADAQRRRGRGSLVPHGVSHGAADQHIQELPCGQSEQEFVFDVQVRRNLVLSTAHGRDPQGLPIGIARWISPEIALASSTTARPPTAANAASLALSMRLGLPLAVMYRNPAQARNTAAAAMATVLAASSSVLNSRMMVAVSLAKTE